VLTFVNRFGRGFSDNPDDLPQDSRLFCSQILIALASSSLSWTGNISGRFTLIGYSLGGGIAASFTSHFPDLISSLVLIAPSGLLRPNRISLRTKFLYSQGLLFEPILTYLVRTRLEGSVAPPRSPPSSKADVQSTEPIKTKVPKHDSNSTGALSRKYPWLSPASIVQFQVEHHLAFVQAYMSSMRYGPITTEHAIWTRIGKRLSSQQHANRVLIICADKDSSIFSSELVADATAALEGNVEFRHFDAGHDVPISRSTEVVAAVWEFWSDETPVIS
jgi:pimeloyl-ACP methyl ester carboxylesterase